MSDMLRKQSTKYYGCCDRCARKIKHAHMKPGPRERHQARAREKRQWKKEAAA